MRDIIKEFMFILKTVKSFYLSDEVLNTLRYVLRLVKYFVQESDIRNF